MRFRPRRRDNIEKILQSIHLERVTKKFVRQLSLITGSQPEVFPNNIFNRWGLSIRNRSPNKRISDTQCTQSGGATREGQSYIPDKKGQLKSIENDKFLQSILAFLRTSAGIPQLLNLLENLF